MTYKTYKSIASDLYNGKITQEQAIDFATILREIKSVSKLLKKLNQSASAAGFTKPKIK